VVGGDEIRMDHIPWIVISLGVPMSPMLRNGHVRSAPCDPSGRLRMVSSPQNEHAPWDMIHPYFWVLATIHINDNYPIDKWLPPPEVREWKGVRRKGVRRKDVRT
jgi:hypothetical protein